MYMDCSVFLFFHFLYMVLQANSLNYSIYGCPTISQLYLVFSNDGVMIFVYMTRLQLARCQRWTLYVFRAHCRSLWPDMVGRGVAWCCVFSCYGYHLYLNLHLQSGLWDLQFLAFLNLMSFIFQTILSSPVVVDFFFFEWSPVIVDHHAC